jgi:hypothetical protein
MSSAVGVLLDSSYSGHLYVIMSHIRSLLRSSVTPPLPESLKMRRYAKKLTPFLSSAIFLNAKLESDLAGFSEEEAQTLLAEYKLEEPGLNSLIKLAYKTLGLMSFLTAGEKEVRAWTIVRGTKAPQAAAEIHTDFEKHFIKADIVPFETFVACSGWFKAREQGKELSVIKLKDGANQHVIQAGDFDTYANGVDRSTPVGVKSAGLHRLSVDGNKANQTIGHHGLAYYGIDLQLEEVEFKNALGVNLYVEVPVESTHQYCAVFDLSCADIAHAAAASLHTTAAEPAAEAADFMFRIPPGVAEPAVVQTLA